MRSSIGSPWLVLCLVAVLVTPAWLAPPASAESLQKHVLAGRSIQAEAAAGRSPGAAPAIPGEPAREDLEPGFGLGIGGVRVTLVARNAVDRRNAH